MLKNIQEFHAVKVTFLSATNTKGARVKMKIGSTSKTIPFNHFFNSDTEIAIDYLENIKGVKIEGVTCVNSDVFLLLNNLITL